MHMYYSTIARPEQCPGLVKLIPVVSGLLSGLLSVQDVILLKTAFGGCSAQVQSIVAGCFGS